MISFRYIIDKRKAVHFVEEATFIVRIDKELLKKLDYVAKYEDRSRNAEVTRLLRQHVAQFELEQEPILLE